MSPVRGRILGHYVAPIDARARVGTFGVPKYDSVFRRYPCTWSFENVGEHAAEPRFQHPGRRTLQWRGRSAHAIASHLNQGQSCCFVWEQGIRHSVIFT